MRARTRRRRIRSQLLSGVSAPLDLSHDEVLADLDAGWADWEPAATSADRPSAAA